MFDFFVEGKLLVEFDGIQHRESVEYFGGQKGFEDRKRRDALRDQNALANDYAMLKLTDDDLVTSAARGTDCALLRVTIESILLADDQADIKEPLQCDKLGQIPHHLDRYRTAIDAIRSAGLYRK